MNPEATNHLKLIGDGLDQMLFPTVHDGGLVWPARTTVVSFPPAMESQYDDSSISRWQRPQQAKRTPSSSAGTSARPCSARTPDQSGAPSAAASLPRNHAALTASLQGLATAYPGTESFIAEDAVWLRVPALLQPNLGHGVIFVVVLMPCIQMARGWAFWDYGCMGLHPIGPRHTNYGDASICAFDERDGTWFYGDSLVSLLDLYCVWAVRQLFVREFGKWPGPQGSFSPFERLREYSDSERCGCDAPAGAYVDCCKDQDLRLLASRTGENLAEAFLPRCVPIAIQAFAQGAGLPNITYNGISPRFGKE